MIPRIIVPADARISDTDNAPRIPSSIEKAHLLPPVAAVAATKSPRHQPMVGKLLVPAGARIGEAVVNPSAPDAHHVAPRHRLFDEVLLTKTALGHKRTAAEWLISFAIHAAVVAAVIIIPLFFTQTINPRQLELTYLIAPPLPAAPPPPPPPAAAIAPRPSAKQIAPVTAKLTMPIAIPKTIPNPGSQVAAEAPPDLLAGVAGGVPGGVPGGQVGGIIGGIAGGTLGGTGLVAPPPPPAAAPTGPLQVGGAVKAPRLIYAPQPEYPILAKQARIQGDVQIDAVIDQNGNVVQEHAVSGSGVLIAAALDAVKQWKYEPTYLNGKPYPVELAVDVTFRL
jgi:protein TonB